MQELIFTLKDNNHTVLEEKLFYTLENNIISFNINSWAIEFQAELNYFSFKRSDTDSVFSIIYKDNKAIGIYTLLKENITFDIEFSHFTYTYSSKKISCEYSIVGEETSIKSICITFLK